MGKVILYTGITKLDLPVDRILENNIGKGLESIVIMGYDADGQEIFASSIDDGSTVLWLIERCKLKLLKVQVPE